MAERDYYVILGISRGETPSGVRSAFRERVRQHHPDRAGPAGAPRFREVVEAYRVLSDPNSRRAYDATLRGEALAAAPRPRSRIDPTWRSAFDLVDPFGDPDLVRPSAEALLDRILRNFGGRGLGKGERLEPLLCDVALDRTEARRGGILPLRIPVTRPCPHCRGTAWVAGFRCRHCDARGEIASEVIVPLEVPPGVRPGTVVEASLDGWGIRNLWLRVRIGVAG